MRKLVLAVVLLITSCSVVGGNQVIVNGSEHSYSIPAQYARDDKIQFYNVSTPGDTSPVFSFLLPLNHLSPEFHPEKEFTLIIYPGSDIGNREKFIPFAIKMIGSSLDKANYKDGHYIYENSLGSRNFTYYLAFDPTSAPETISQPYLVKLSVSSPFQLEAQVVIPQRECTFYFPWDGLGIAVTFMGDEICEHSDYSNFFSKLQNMMQSWKIKSL